MINKPYFMTLFLHLNMNNISFSETFQLLSKLSMSSKPLDEFQD